MFEPHSHADSHGHHTWNEPSKIEARVRALESLLVEKGVTTHDSIDTLVAAFENDLGPMHGAKVVAKAWTDPAYRKRLEEDGNQRDRRARLSRPTDRAREGPV